MLPFFVIIFILVGSVVGQIMFGSKDNSDQTAGKHVASRSNYNSRKAWSFSIQLNKALMFDLPNIRALFFILLYPRVHVVF